MTVHCGECGSRLCNHGNCPECNPCKHCGGGDRTDKYFGEDEGMYYVNGRKIYPEKSYQEFLETDSNFVFDNTEEYMRVPKYDDIPGKNNTIEDINGDPVEDIHKQI